MNYFKGSHKGYKYQRYL